MACIYKIRLRTRIIDGQTQMVEEEYLVKSLEDLGYTWEENVRLDTGGPRVDIRVMVGNRYIGFRKAGGAYEVVSRGKLTRRQEKFLGEVTQRYVYHTARAKLEAQGFELAVEEAQEGNQIHLVLRRMV
jgi:hypothetical protein